jgi:large subunit ribosomal protein L25
MSNVTELKAGLREITGKSSKKLAGDGLVPATVYGPKFETISISVDRRDFDRMMHDAAVGSTLVDLTIEGRDKPVDVIIKEVKRDPLKGTVQHIDFWAVDMSETIQTVISITYVGSAAGEREGGVMMHALRELKVEARPKDLPEHIEVDVSALEIGDSITVADITAPTGVALLDDPDATVASVSAPAVEEEVVVEEGIEMGEVPEVGKESDEETEE